MIQQDIAVLESGQRVGLALNKFVAEVEGFAPLLEANEERAALVAAIEQKAAAQGQETTSATLTKDQLREQLAQATATLSARATAYALSIGDLGLKQALTLSYSDVRYGDATEDVAHVRALVDRVQALPAAMLTRFRITAALLQAPLAAAEAFTLAADEQTVVQSGTRLAGQALPELLTRLQAQLQLLDRLLLGMRSDPDPRWEELYQAFRDANKRREGQASVVRRVV